MAVDNNGKLSGCSVTENGQCALHGIEVERRKGDRRVVEEVKDQVEKNTEDLNDLKTFRATADDSIGDLEDETKRHKEHIGDLLTSKNIGYGAALLLSLFLTGSFIYTYITKVELMANCQQTLAKVAVNTEDIDRLSEAIAGITMLNKEMAMKMSRDRHEIDRNHDAIAKIMTELTALATRSDERQLAWLEKWDVTNDRLSQLVNIINEERRQKQAASQVTRVRLLEEQPPRNGEIYEDSQN